MSAERFIAGKLRFQGKLAVTATAISFFVMIIAVSVSGGFRREIRHGVSEISGDVLLTSAYFNYYSESDPISISQSYIPMIEGLDGVERVTPAVYRAGIAKAGGEMAGILVKGTPDFTGAPLQADIPELLATQLGLGPGDKLPVYFIGGKVKVRNFIIRSITGSSIDSGENALVSVAISDLQRLNGWEEDKASAVEIILSDKLKGRSDMKRMNSEIGSIATMYASGDDDVLVATSAIDKYSQLFDWLDLIDFNVLAILLLMTVVAGFNMISGLLILLFRNISTIGTLKAMGMTNRGIGGVFLRLSARIVATGMATGNAAALAFCAIQGATHMLKLNPENYFVSFVPVSVDIPMIVLADVLAFAAIMALLLIPCMFIAKVDPATTVRTE